MPEFFWWHFFDCYARGATGLGEDERAVVLARMARAPGPGGVLEAQCLDTFSRWRWAAGDADAAIEFARRAVAADATWPYGHITLAWYGLVTGKFDPLPILREAVRASPAAREEIRANADFARFPELIAVLEGRG